MEHITFSRVRLLIILLFCSFTSYTQTTCTFDEVLFSGTVTTSTVGATKFKASDATSNYRFGERVAIDGNIAITVSRSNATAAGKVYVFINDGSGNWSQQTILTASDGFAGDNFGSAVALEGNYLVVGARSQLNATGVDTGAAYLFEYDGSSTWTEKAIFEPSDGTTGIRFGESVSIEGDLVLVGARNGCTGGCAYLYENDGTNTFTYTETKLEPQVQSNYANARFGYDVLIKDGRAYVGGLQDYSVVGNASAGSVQIWDRANDGSWSRTHRLRGTETSESFGCSISVQGDYLAIGAYNFETSTTTEADQGRVYVYKADTNGDYLEVNRVMIQNDDKDSYNDQRFGTDIVLEDDFLYVGTFGNGANSSDAVYVFKDDGTNTWTQISKITSGGGWDEFSNRAVAASFPYLLIGQNEDDSPSNSGAIHFVPLASDITPTASVTEVTDVYIGQNNGTIKVNFDDEATRSQIAFSIDGGTTYPYVFNDAAGNGEIANLGLGSYQLRAAFEDGSCILDLGTVTIGQATYTQIPDANFEAALEALGYDDITGDGQVPTSLIEGVTSLDVSNEGIADLTGINDFVALETLRLQYNSLTTLDISNLLNLRVLWAANGNIFSSIDVSNNLLLEDFRIRQYTGTSIDISANTALTRFACTSCDLLTVNTSTNINLSYLDLWNSDITSLDLSLNTSLATLDIYSTNLTTLDLSNNTSLTNLIANDITTLSSLNIQNGANTSITGFNTTGTPVPCILVDDAAWSTANWTNVDITPSFSDTYCEYTAIPDTNFEAALNALGYDDVLGDGQVPTVLIEVVTSLDVRNQNIADVTGIQDFVALSDLNVEMNTLTSLDVSNNTNLQTLVFDNNTISNLNLGTISSLTSIEGRYNQLTTIDLSQNGDLTFINLRDNLFTTVNVSNNPLLETINLRGCTNLTTIDLSNNPNVKSLFFQDTALNGLDVSQNILLENIIIERVNFNSIDVSNLSNLVQLRIGDNSFTELDVSNNPLLVRLECENNNLTYLNLKNGNNTNMPNADFKATGNPDLTCILVDDAIWSAANWDDIDGTATFTDTYCRYTTIPDTNFEAALEALGYDDISADGQVPTALIEVVTDLNVDSKGILDLTGIEDFTALISLSCFDNALSTIDLSSNLDLESLMLKENSLTSVNVLNNTELVSLRISDNSLTSLDVSNNVNLSTLRCDTNNLSVLDVSNNTQLVNLDVYNMATLTSLNIDSNVNLQSLKANNTSIAAIDFSNNPLLRVAYLHQTSIANVDFSQNPLIEELKLQNTQITTLDLSLQTALTSLNCSQNSLSYLKIQSGTNTLISEFDATSNPNLTCILVDDATYSNGNSIWADNVDSGVTFNDGTYCRYTLIPDTIFEAELEALGYDDISGDGQVPTALIEELTTLALPNKGINDLTGIEDFVALITLNCRLNNLTTLDISQNILLTTLTADTNSIATIDLSNNTDLAILNLAGSDLTTLDISNNTSLRKLFVQGNTGLTSLDISNNVELVEFRTYNTAIASLDLDIHPDLELLESYNTPLTTIDVSNNPLLEVLRVDNTGITDLDLSNNPSVRSLRVNDTGIERLDLSNQTALEVLYAHDTSLNYLNVQNGNNTNITTFRIENNPNLSCVVVDNIAFAEANFTDIDATTSFSDTYCRYTAIPDVNFEAALEALGYDDISGDGQVPTALIEVVTSLDVRSNGITDVTGIADFTALEVFNCNLNNIDTLDVSTNVNLTALQCTANPIESLNLTNNTQLVELNCRSTDITSLDLTNNTLLKRIIFFDTDITSIDLSNNLLLEQVYGYNTSLTSLDLSLNTALKLVQVQNSDLVNLNVKNGNNTNITNFNASGNPDLSCILVDDLANDYSTWTKDATANFSDTLCILYTQIPDANFEARLEALGYDDISADGKVPTALIEVATNLNVVNQGITDLTGIEDFTGLISINVSDNNIGSLDMSNSPNLASLTANACGLTDLDISQNLALFSLSADSNLLTSLNITNNTGLESVVIYGNLITTVDFSTNTALDNLDVFQNQLTSLDLSTNTRLEILQCDNNNITRLDLSQNTDLKIVSCSENELTSLNIQNGNNTAITAFNAVNNPSLSCILVDDVTYSTTYWTNIDGTASFNEVSCEVRIAAKAFLQGAFLNPNTGEENLMRDDLRVANLIPTTSPYDSITCDPSVFNTTGTDAIVDWVLIELRDTTDTTIVLASQSALLQRDGDVVDLDGTSAVTINSTTDTYYVALKHRNHIGILTSNPIALSATTTSLDLSTDVLSVKGGALALKDMGSGIYAIYAGDATGDGNILNTDISNAINASGGINIYSGADANMDGNILNTDIALIIQPNAGRIQQF